MTWNQYKEKWIKNNTCRFCPGSRMHTCTSFRCQPAHEKAEEYLENAITGLEVAKKKRKYIKAASPGELGTLPITEAWRVSDGRSEELVIRFEDNIPNMQQYIYLEMIRAHMPHTEQIRAWKEEDGETIRDGIPADGKKEENNNGKI